MDKIQLYLEIVPLPVLLMAPVVAIVAWVFVPARLRLSLALALLVPWLTVGRLPGLGMVQSLAKTTEFAAYLLVTLAAFLHAGPRRQLPLIVWLYPATAVLGFIYIWTVTDVALAFVLRLQWLLLVVAAMAVVQTITDEESLLHVLRAFTVGVALATLIPFTDLLLHPGAAFRAGLGRFYPYGANPNQIGIAFAMAAPLTAYGALRSRHALMKPVLLGISVLAFGMGLLTASRSTMAVLLAALVPVGWRMARKAAIAVLAGVIALGGLYAILSLGAEGRFSRLGKLETNRPEIVMQYLGIIAERPLFGLLESEGESFLSSTSEGATHPHNAYIETLYLGGITFGIPNFLLVAVSIWCTYNVWRRRKWFSTDPVLTNMLIVFMAMVYAHGFVNGSIYYPTYGWAFFHVFLSILFIALSTDITMGVYDPLPAAHADDQLDESEYEPEASEEEAVMMLEAAGEPEGNDAWAD